MRQAELMELLLEESSGRVGEEELDNFREMMPQFRESELTGMDLKMTLKTAEGKEYTLDFSRDGRLEIYLSDQTRIRSGGAEPGQAQAGVYQGDGEPEKVQERYPGREHATEIDVLAGPVTDKTRDELADARLRKVIFSVLSDIKFSLRASGTVYLVDGIIMALGLKNETQRMGMTKEIYPCIAALHGVSVGSVERNIRLAIETAWSRMSCEYAMTHYPYEYSSKLGRPTNQEFIFAMAGMVRRSYPEYAMWCRKQAERE